MFIIENNAPYLIKGDKAFKVSFGERGQVKVDDSEYINVRGQRYTYDEIMSKFNIRYLIEAKKKELADNEEIATLKQENEKLLKKIATLEKQLEAKTTNEETKTAKKK